MAGGKLVKFRRRKKKNKSKASQALNLAKENKRFIQKTIEMKQVNYQTSGQAIASGGFTAASFAQLATGPEDGTALGSASRIGNSITLMKQQVCMNIVGSSTDTYNQMRVLIVESVNGNQALGLSDVLEYGSYALYGNNVFSSPYTTKTSTNKRYKVHYDRSFIISGLPTKGGVPPAKNIKHIVRFGKAGKELEYAGAGSLNPNNHRLTLMVVSDSVSATHPALAYSVRTSYKDA